MNQSRKIAWEKFTPSYESKKFDTHEIDEEDDREEDLEEESEEMPEMLGFVNLDEIISRRKIKTPFGYYELDDDFSPYNMFDCWIGHTNFKITKRDFNILNKKIEGIGCLKVLSPYRFFIGIEKMFSFPAVRIQIQKDLCNNLEMQDEIEQINNNVDHTINMVISKINDALFSIRDSEKWAVYISREGEVKTIKNSEFDSDIEYQNKLKSLKSLKNGNIITYDSL
jgi:hypothetical protein